MGLSFSKKAIFFVPKRKVSRRLGTKIVQYFNSEHARKPKFGLFCDNPFSLFFLAPFLTTFSSLLLSLPSAFNILSGCRKTLGANCCQSLQMGPRSIIGIVDHFPTIFATKLIAFFFNLLCQNAVDFQNRLLCG